MSAVEPKDINVVGNKHDLDKKDDESNQPVKKQQKQDNHHKSYSDYQKELVVLANQQGGREFRLKVATLIGMPASTADHIVYQYKQHGDEAFHDHRHDVRTHIGKNAKKDSQLLKLVSEWLHMDAKLTHAQIRELVNLEVFRRILKEQNLPLDSNEKECNAPITADHIEKYFAEESVRSAYKKQHIEREETIANWLQNTIISRKHFLDDSNMVNSDENKKERLVFAKDLLKALEDDNAVLVFVDELPLWLNMHHPPGKAKDDKIHEHCHCFLAAQPSLGLIKTEIFATETPPEQKHGLEHRPDQWKKFVDELCESLMNKLDQVKGKDIYIIADVPLQYIESVQQHKSIKSVPNWGKLSAKLEEAGNKVFLIKQSGNSPPLNLGEYYNSEVKSKANDLLHELCVNEASHKDFIEKSDPHHQLLSKILGKVLKEMDAEPMHASFVTRLTESVQDVISAEGALDFAKVYAHLFK